MISTACHSRWPDGLQTQLPTENVLRNSIYFRRRYWLMPCDVPAPRIARTDSLLMLKGLDTRPCQVFSAQRTMRLQAFTGAVVKDHARRTCTRRAVRGEFRLLGTVISYADDRAGN